MPTGRISTRGEPERSAARLSRFCVDHEPEPRRAAGRWPRTRTRVQIPDRHRRGPDQQVLHEKTCPPRPGQLGYLAVDQHPASGRPDPAARPSRRDSPDGTGAMAGLSQGHGADGSGLRWLPVGHAPLVHGRSLRARAGGAALGLLVGDELAHWTGVSARAAGDRSEAIVSLVVVGDRSLGALPA